MRSRNTAGIGSRRDGWRRANWKPYAAGAVVTAVIIAIWLIAAQPSAPPGERDDAYAAQVVIQNARVLAGDSIMAGRVVYYKGTIVNRGGRTVTGYTVELTFNDIDGQPVERDRRALLAGHVSPIAPHSSRDFEIGFDKVPDNWNQAPPEPRGVEVYVR